MATNSYKRIGEGLVRDQKSKTIYCRFRHGGKLIRQSLKTKDKVIAKNRLAELQKELSEAPLEPQTLEGEEISFSISHYLISLENLSKSVRERARDTMKHFNEEFGQRLPKELKPMEIQTWLSKFREKRHFGADRWNKHITTL